MENIEFGPTITGAELYKMADKIIPDNLSHHGFERGKNPEPIDIDKISDVFLFVRGNFRKIKSLNYKHSSYGLKHIAERTIGRYVSNGELIAAMILQGYNYKPYGKINAIFNVSEAAVIKADYISHGYSAKDVEIIKASLK